MPLIEYFTLSPFHLFPEKTVGLSNRYFSDYSLLDSFFFFSFFVLFLIFAFQTNTTPIMRKKGLEISFRWCLDWSFARLHFLFHVFFLFFFFNMYEQ